MTKIDFTERKSPIMMTETELRGEVLELRAMVDFLQKENDPDYDVFSEGSLDDILNSCDWKSKYEKPEKKTSSIGMKRTQSKMLENMRMQYSRYRKAFSEMTASREVLVNLNMIMKP